MPYQFDLDLRARVVSTLPAADHLGVAPAHDATLTIVRNFLSGTGAGQCDCLYERRRSLASGAVDTIDLNTSVTDVFGNPVSMITVVAFILVNEGVDGVPNTTSLTIGGGGALGMPNLLGNTSATKIVRPGGVFLTVENGITGVVTVTPGSADTFTITNAAGATNNYQLIIVGRTV